MKHWNSQLIPKSSSKTTVLATFSTRLSRGTSGRLQVDHTKRMGLNLSLSISRDELYPEHWVSRLSPLSRLFKSVFMQLQLGVRSRSIIGGHTSEGWLLILQDDYNNFCRSSTFFLLVYCRTLIYRSLDSRSGDHCLYHKSASVPSCPLRATTLSIFWSGFLSPSVIVNKVIVARSV